MNTWEAEWAQRAGDLIALLTTHPEGLTLTQIMWATKWSESMTRTVLHRARLRLRDEGFNIMVENLGFPDPAYKLAADSETSEVYRSAHRRNIHAQTEVAVAWASSLVNATDERTLEGKRARRVLISSRRLLEDLQMLQEDEVA